TARVAPPGCEHVPGRPTEGLMRQVGRQRTEFSARPPGQPGRRAACLTGARMPPHMRTLIIENEPPVGSPTPDDLRAPIERMGHAGPGCVIVEAGDGYASVVGGEGRYAAEWREPAGDGFRHWVAGRREEAAGTATISAGAFDVTVRAAECLSAPEV